MSLEINNAARTSGANAAKGAAAEAATSKAAPKKEPIPVGQKKAKAQKGTDLTEPKRPKPEGTKDVKVGFGQNLFDIATKYHVSIADVVKANPGLDPDKIKEGQTLKMPFVSDKNWANYEKAKDDYERKAAAKFEQEYKAEKAKNLKEKTQLAQAKIQEAKELKHGESYNFTVDKKTGNIIVTLKKDMDLGDIRNDFRLPGGHLRQMNPDITKKYQPDKLFNLDELRREANWDGADVKAGDKFVIDPNAFKPSKGFFGDLFD